MKHHSERENKSVIKKIFISLIALILFLVQAFLLYLLLFETSNIRWLYIIVELIGLIIVIYLFDRKMTSSYKLIWTILILIMPFTGTLIFLFFGNERTFPKEKSRKIKEALKEFYVEKPDNFNIIKEFNPIAYKHTMIVNNGCDLPAYTNTLVKFYSNIEEKHNDMLKDMMEAKQYIFMEFFIMSNGTMFNSLMEVLEKKASEGIEIKICYDDFGSKFGLKENSFNKIKKYDNVKINKFAALGYALDFSVNYRNHRKNVIIDGKIAYSGGDNLADEYANYKTKYGYWRDNAVRLEGEAVTNNLIIFAESWYISSKEVLDINIYKNKESIKTTNIVMPYGDGPTDQRNPASDLYTSITNNAQKYLYISTPYLIIDNEFIDHLCNAAKSGVDVRILVPGVPDKKIVYILTESHFGSLLKAGVKIYKYTPGFNHAKNYICDDLFSVVGSINLDYRSLYLHFENGVYIFNDEAIIKMRDNFLEDLSQSEEVTFDKWKKRKWYKRMIEFIVKMFSPLM